MGKVRLTKEQADAVKSIKDTDYAINIHGLNKRPDSPLRELTTAELARALYIGYKVEPEFKVGDWVYVKGIFRSVSPEIAKVTDVKTHRMILDNGFDLGKGSITSDTVRLATPEEIKQEKERRWWNKHGRDVWELKKGDVIGINIKTITINEVREDGYIAYFDGLGSDRIYRIDSLKSGGYKIICFAEDRKDIDAE